MLDHWITEFQIGLLDALKACLVANEISAEFGFSEKQFQPKKLGLQRNIDDATSELIVISGILYDPNEGKPRSRLSRQPVIQIAAYAGSPRAALFLRGKAERAIADSFRYEFCESFRFLSARGSVFDRTSGVHIASRDLCFLIKPCPLLPNI